MLQIRRFYLTFSLFNKDRVASVFLAERSGIRLGSALGGTKSSTSSLARVGTALEVELAGHVGANVL